MASTPRTISMALGTSMTSPSSSRRSLKRWSLVRLKVSLPTTLPHSSPRWTSTPSPSIWQRTMTCSPKRRTPNVARVWRQDGGLPLPVRCRVSPWHESRFILRLTFLPGCAIVSPYTNERRRTMEDQFESPMDAFDDEGYAFHHFMDLLRQQEVEVLHLQEVVVPHEVFVKLGTEFGVESA